MSETAPEEAPVPSALADAIADIAEQIHALSSVPPTNVRVGTVTAVETSGNYRCQLDITGTAWLYKTADAVIGVGDRVWAVQQDAVFIVGGKLNTFDSLAPVGAVMPYVGSTAPAGWLLANGSAVSRTTYAALFAVCGTSYGSGDGSTTFNVPNLVDRFAVGAGSTYSRGSTGGATSHTLSSSNLPGHTHSFSATSGSGGSHGHTGTAASGGSHSHTGTAASGGSHTHSEEGTTTRSDLLASGGTTAALPAAATTGSGGSHSHSLSVDSGGSHTHSLSIDSASTHTHSVSGTTGSTGSGTSVDHLPPYVGMTYIVRAL